jgi:hypothetical protein
MREQNSSFSLLGFVCPLNGEFAASLFPFLNIAHSPNLSADWELDGSDDAVDLMMCLLGVSITAIFSGVLSPKTFFGNSVKSAYVVTQQKATSSSHQTD